MKLLRSLVTFILALNYNTAFIFTLVAKSETMVKSPVPSNPSKATKSKDELKARARLAMAPIGSPEYNKAKSFLSQLESKTEAGQQRKNKTPKKTSFSADSEDISSPSIRSTKKTEHHPKSNTKRIFSPSTKQPKRMATPYPQKTAVRRSLGLDDDSDLEDPPKYDFQGQVDESSFVDPSSVQEEILGTPQKLNEAVFGGAHSPSVVFLLPNEGGGYTPQKGSWQAFHAQRGGYENIAPSKDVSFHNISSDQNQVGAAPNEGLHRRHRRNATPYPKKFKAAEESDLLSDDESDQAGSPRSLFSKTTSTKSEARFFDDIMALYKKYPDVFEKGLLGVLFLFAVLYVVSRMTAYMKA